MPKLNENRVPKYRLHKQSGQAIVTLSGKDYLLGPYQSKASKTRYDRLVAEWIAAGRQPLHVGRTADGDSASAPFTILNLCAAYWRHAKTYYTTPTSGELGKIKRALNILKANYRDLPAVEFGPLKAKALRLRMIEKGWCRTSCNASIGIVKRMFKWAVENEMIPAPVYQALVAVSGLHKGRSEARESDPVRPVAEEHVRAIFPHVAPQVRAMLELQLLTGMRSGEVCQMRTGDIDTTGKLWVYTPRRHKTAHHGHRRQIQLGPKAQEVLRPFLKTDLQAHIFTPAEADEWHREQKRLKRRTRLSCGNVPGSNRIRRQPKRAPGEKWDRNSYARAVTNGCDAAFPPPARLARKQLPGNGRKANSTRWETAAEWKERLTKEKRWAELQAWRKQHRFHPHQLRHTCATLLRKHHGIEAARVVLGHRSAMVTEIYAEIDQSKAEQIMALVG